MLNPNNIRKEFDPTSFNTQPKYSTERIDTSQIDQLTVWQSIIGNNVELNKPFTSCFRQDNTPGCNLKLSNNNNVIFLDRTGRPFHGYTCFKAWMEINHVDFRTALTQIINKVPSCVNVIRNVVEIKKEPIKYKPIYRKWSVEGKKWWANYGIDNLSGIREVIGYETNNSIVKFQSLTFCYIYKYNIKNEKLPEEEWLYKFYTPKSETNLKSSWLGSITKDRSFFVDNRKLGFTKLMFCKSLKCQRVLETLLGNMFSYIHPQSELIGGYPHLDLLAEFDMVFTWFDEDPVGRLSSDKFTATLNNKNIPNKQLFTENYKDISDMVKAEGKQKTLDFLLKLIGNTIK